MILANFDLQVIPILSIKYWFDRLFGSEMMFKPDFQNGRRGSDLGYPIETILLNLIHNSPQYVLSSFKSLGLQFRRNLGYIFKTGLRRSSYISDRNDFSNSLIYMSPWYSLTTFKSFGFSVQEKKNSKQISKMAAEEVILDFRLERFLLFLSTSQPRHVLTSCENWLFGSGEEVQNRFSRRPPAAVLDFPNWTNFSLFFFFFFFFFFLIYQVLSQLGFRSWRSSKWILKMAAIAVIFDFRSERMY